MTIDRWIGGHARFTPDKPAIHFNNETLTYGDLNERIAASANLLERRLGIARGDRIAWYGLNHPEMVVLLFAAARIGAILVPLNWRLAVPELRYVIGDCAPKVLFHDQHFEDKVDEIAAAASGCSAIPVHGEAGANALPAMRLAAGQAEDAPSSRQAAGMEDPVLVVYTSGTTGNPKGAVLTQNAMRCNALMSQHAHDMTSADHVLNVLPLFHVGGINIQTLPALFFGATLTLLDRFDPEATLAVIEKARISLVLMVPTVLQAMVAAPAWADTDLTSLRAMGIGSTDVPVELIRTLHARDVPMIQIYGATETGPIAIYQRISEARTSEGSIGRAGLLCDVRLVDGDGNDVGDGEAGEIWVRGENILSRYWNNEEATGLAIIDGWFRTGDVARLGNDGNYWFVDRIKHIIISGGENIYPAELELERCCGTAPS